jgi:hypothetical protein
MLDKPLHVQVAEALGWRDCRPFEADGIVDYQTWCGEQPGVEGMEAHTFIPDFDTDWSATGPLIEKYGIYLNAATDGWHACRECQCAEYGHNSSDGDGPTPLTAVCNLILALKEAGKL